MKLKNLNILMEVASPHQIRSGGEGWQINAGFSESPFGTCLIAEGPQGICYFSFPATQKNFLFKDIQKDWPKASIIRDDSRAKALARQIFKTPETSNISRKPIRVFVKGTPFQVRVWQSLLRIPCGTVVSYGHLASQVKKPKAFRAVGTAVGKNPLAYLIPCHRVIRADGLLGNYFWGPSVKRALLDWEGVNTSQF